MLDVLGQLTDGSFQPAWMQPVCDTAIFAASLVIACLIAYAMVHRRTGRVPATFWLLGALAFGCGLLQMSVVARGAFAMTPLSSMTKIGAALLLWVSSPLLFNYVLASKYDPSDPELADELMRKLAEREQVEASLRDSADRYRTILNNTRDVIIYVDTLGRFLGVNKRVEEVFGYRPEELIGKRFTEVGILQLRDIPKIAGLFRDTLLAGKPRGLIELELRHRNGASVFVEVGTRFIRQGSRVVEVVCVFRDVSDRKRVEDALWESEEQYRLIFESVTDGLIIFDLEGKIAEVNPAVCAIYGYQRDEMLGLRGYEIIHPDHRWKFDAFGETLAVGKPFCVESLDLRKDGTAFPVEVRGRSFLYRGKPHLLAVVRDVTWRSQSAEDCRAENADTVCGVKTS